jgi:anti-sigma factor RsiW
VTAPTCSEVREAAAEYALDILEPHERSVMAAHLLRCPACRAEVEVMSGIGTRLLELVPGTEPPLGFDERVLAAVRPDVRAARRVWHRPAPRLFAGAAAAVAAVILAIGSLSLGWFHDGSTSPAPRAVLTAQFLQGGREVGELYASAHPAWLDMTVKGVTGADEVTCQLVGKDGKVTTVGSFDLVGGNGTWGAPDPQGGLADVRGARLVDGSGRVLATATLH